jgi:hypothetical protein
MRSVNHQLTQSFHGEKASNLTKLIQVKIECEEKEETKQQ